MGRQLGAEARKIVMEMVRLGGVTIEKIAELVGVNRKTISRWIVRDKSGEGQEHRAKSGRPKVISEEKGREIENFVQNHPTAYIKEIKEELCLSCSLSTIRNYLHKVGISNKKTSVRASQQNREDVKKKEKSGEVLSKVTRAGL